MDRKASAKAFDVKRGALMIILSHKCVCVLLLGIFTLSLSENAQAFKRLILSPVDQALKQHPTRYSAAGGDPGEFLQRLAEHPETFSALEELDLSHDDVRDNDLKNLPYLTHLQTLDLFDTYVGDGSVDGFRQLPALQTLDLCYTDIGDAGIQQISHIRTLERLYLAGTDITDQALKDLDKLPLLKELWVNKTVLSREALKDFQQRHPRLEISAPRPGEAVGRASLAWHYEHLQEIIHCTATQPIHDSKGGAEDGGLMEVSVQIPVLNPDSLPAFRKVFEGNYVVSGYATDALMTGPIGDRISVSDCAPWGSLPRPCLDYSIDRRTLKGHLRYRNWQNGFSLGFPDASVNTDLQCEPSHVLYHASIPEFSEGFKIPLKE